MSSLHTLRYCGDACPTSSHSFVRCMSVGIVLPYLRGWCDTGAVWALVPVCHGPRAIQLASANGQLAVQSEYGISTACHIGTVYAVQWSRSAHTSMTYRYCT